MKKNVWTLLLAVILIISLMPATVFAARDSQAAVVKTAPAELEQPLELNGVMPQASYSVSLSGGSHGYTELLTGSSAEAGSEVFFVADPDDGYLAEVYVSGLDPEALLYTGYDLWGFYMPYGNVVIEVRYVEAPGEAHDVTVIAGQGGQYALDRDSARQDESVYLAVKPNDPSAFLEDQHIFATSGDLYFIYEEEGIYYYELFMGSEDTYIFVEYKKSGPFAVSTQITSGEGGTVTLAQNEAWYLDTVTATVVPDTGYEVLSVQAVSHDGLLVSNASWVGSQYSFTMHPGDTTVQVYFSKILYPIYVNCLPGGTAYATHSQAQMGDTVTLVCEPEPGYAVKSITGVDQITDLGDNRYSFVMPAQAVSIEVEFGPASYPVNVVMETTVGGTVTADLTEAFPGDPVTLTVSLEEGYRLAKLTGVEYTDNGDGTYSFTMPGKAVELHAWILREDNPFLDVHEPRFYYDPVMWAVENGITSGMTPDTFAPGNACTRGQVVTFLWRALGKPEPTITEHPFTDVKEGAYYYKAMLWAVENGVTSGMSADTFAPDAACTRGQVVTFLWRAYGKTEPTVTEHPFTDVSERAFYYKAMLWAVENGVTSGMGANSFAPDGSCTRGHVVTFLYRADQIPTEPTAP